MCAQHAGAVVCQQNGPKSNAKQKRYARARQHNFRQHSMERRAAAMGLTIHTKCLCGCGLCIKPSLKRCYAPGHRKLHTGVTRVLAVPRCIQP